MLIDHQRDVSTALLSNNSSPNKITTSRRQMTEGIGIFRLAQSLING